ncbi:hypothetical protein [uncultured Nostoc sp.]|uniref:hypothetical protein n=1 Tax=uncultured Nostoc sp. TaxID=340711 RepID=UPI0035CA86ED
MKELTPDMYPECPLGLECTEFGEQTKFGKHNEFDCYSWWKCPNREYCVGVCEAWEIPLLIEDRCTEVKLFLPYNYHEKTFAQEMRKYGYAEAENFPYHRGEHYDFYTVGNELLVIENKFKYGFAIAVNLNRKIYHIKYDRYVVDKNGLWWCTLGRPPKVY